MYPAQGSDNFQQELLARPEFLEVKSSSVRVETVDQLRALRQRRCGSLKFQLTEHQVFLKRFFSEHTPYRSAIFYHGTGVGKTCTAIAIAEEYLAQPRNEDKRVVIVANQSVQANFAKEIFNIDQVRVGPRGYVTSKQCTGMTYVHKVQNQRRSQFNLSSHVDRSYLDYEVQQLLRRRYDIQGYIMFSNEVLGKKEMLSAKAYGDWLKQTFSDRLIIVDEAHNVRPGQAAKEKRVEQALQDIVKHAENASLVLMSATPMYDTFQEILWLLNLCIWNDKRTDLADMKHGLRARDFFRGDSDSRFIDAAAETLFRQLCKTYISFIQGNDPLRFPFMLKPGDAASASDYPTVDAAGAMIAPEDRITRLPLVLSKIDVLQEAASASIDASASADEASSQAYNVIYPKPAENLSRAMSVSGGRIRYAGGMPRFLGPELLSKHSPKIARIMQAVENSEGVIFIHSYYIDDGCIPVALALEEAGFLPFGREEPYLVGVESKGQSPGRYAIIAGENGFINMDEESVLRAARHPDNKNGEALKVIIGSFKVSEGIDFQYIRQVHILEPWYNLSRIEQVVGRGLRACSHSVLPFAQQNTTVYLHAVVGDRETSDLRAYRIAERKQRNIARLLKIIQGSAFDCAVMEGLNQIDASLLSMPIEQIRSEDGQTVTAPIGSLRSFLRADNEPVACEDTEAVPLKNDFVPRSFLLERTDDIVEKLRELFAIESVWKRKDLLQAANSFPPEAIIEALKTMTQDPKTYTVVDKQGRVGFLEAMPDDVYAVRPQSLKRVGLLNEFERTSVPPEVAHHIPANKARIGSEPALRPLEAFQKHRGDAPVAQAFDTWDKLEQRYKLFKFLVLHASEYADLYMAIVAPRSVTLETTVEGRPASKDVFMILDGKGKLQWPYLDEEGDWDDNAQPIGPLARAIDDYEKTFRKEFTLLPETQLVGFSEYDPDNKRFLLKVSRKKGDFRGRDCSTLLSAELQQLEGQLGLAGGEQANRSARCKLIDQAIRENAEARYFIPEQREILRVLRKSDF